MRSEFSFFVLAAALVAAPASAQNQPPAGQGVFDGTFSGDSMTGSVLLRE